MKYSVGRDVRYIYLLIVLLVISLSVMREPLFFTSPRIWAEEGAVHIKAVMDDGAWKSFFEPHLGYYSLFNNLVASLGLSLFGFNKIAYVTTYSSFVVILFTVFAPLILNSDLWDTLEKKILLIFFSLMIGLGEIWVNTINSQFYFCLFACYLLLSEIEYIRGWRYAYVVFMLVGGGFTGVTTVALVPFFVYKYLSAENRGWRGRVLLYVLLGGLMVQLFSISYLSICTSYSRFSLSNIVNFPFGVLENLCALIPGIDKGARWAIFSLITFFVVKNHRSAISDSSVLVLLLYISVFIAFFAWNMRGGGRYGYAPSVIFYLYLINVEYLSFNKQRIHHVMVWSLLVLSFIRFFSTKDVYDHKWSSFNHKSIYRNSDGNLEIKIFPQWRNTDWKISFTDEAYTRMR